MRWTRHGVVCVSHADERHGADGEVVWSWPPGAEAKVVGFDEFDGRQGQESRSLGRSRISRETIAQGMPDDPADPVVTAACTFFARGPWVRPSPGIPCALSVGGRTNRQDSDAKCVAGMLAFDSRHASPCRNTDAAAASRFDRRRLWNTGSRALRPPRTMVAEIHHDRHYEERSGRNNPGAKARVRITARSMSSGRAFARTRWLTMTRDHA
jgi:hypothetical protein